MDRYYSWFVNQQRHFYSIYRSLQCIYQVVGLDLLRSDLWIHLIHGCLVTLQKKYSSNAILLTMPQYTKRYCICQLLIDSSGIVYMHIPKRSNSYDAAAACAKVPVVKHCLTRQCIAKHENGLLITFFLPKNVQRLHGHCITREENTVADYNAHGTQPTLAHSRPRSLASSSWTPLVYTCWQMYLSLVNGTSYYLYVSLSHMLLLRDDLFYCSERK